MAKKSIKGGILASETTITGSLYSVRGDGAILRQLRIGGRLEGATIVAKIKPEVEDKVGTFGRYLRKRGLVA